eukprot:GEMP01031659.1.p1 GENE.GEMP01031659.1~~GEMP01031659.1.p1  ORF type:complete len:621 (+),score=108.67 GEMP01031659.1:19-1881(+)
MGLLFWDTVPWVKASGIVDCSSCVVGSYLYVLGQKKAEHDEKCRVRSWLRRYSLIDGFSEDFLLEKTAEYMVYVPKASDGTLFLFHCPETWNSDYRYEVYSCDIKTTEDNSNVIMSPIWVAGRGAGIAPKKRLGASVVTDGRDIYFLAGTIQFPGDATASFIYKFDCERQEWTTVLPIRGSFPSTAPLEPGYRSFRTEQAVICCYNKIFLFGGRVWNDEQKQFAYTDNFSVFNLRDESWNTIEKNGNRPWPQCNMQYKALFWPPHGFLLIESPANIWLFNLEPFTKRRVESTGTWVQLPKTWFGPRPRDGPLSPFLVEDTLYTHQSPGEEQEGEDAMFKLALGERPVGKPLGGAEVSRVKTTSDLTIQENFFLRVNGQHPVADGTKLNASGTSVPLSECQTELDLLRDKDHVDVDFEVDNSLFSAHRFVLSRFSPVFAQLFATGDRTIKIDNCSARIFHLVLHHFYSRFLLPMRTNGHEEAEQLLKAALRFKIAPLLQLCQEKIELTAKNIESLFRMSKNQSDLDILRQRCRAFVANKPETFEEFIDKSAAGVELHQQPGERTLSQPAQGHFVPPQINPPRTLNFWRLVPPRTEPPKVNLQRRILPPLVQAPVLHRWPKS